MRALFTLPPLCLGRQSDSLSLILMLGSQKQELILVKPVIKTPNNKKVLCVSWNPSLASTREMLLTQAGYTVISALGLEEAASLCRATADLLVLGHSVPRDKKQVVIECFREHSRAPILSLLTVGQEKLPNADYGVEAHDPANFVQAVKMILT